MKRLSVLAPAEREMIDAALYYDAQASGLGNDFLNEIDTAIKRILDFPDASPVAEREIRRHLVGRFPYAVLYRQDSEEIVILAIMHMRRHPNYWTDRIG